MTERAINVHATVIVVGTKGLLFSGPSGSGKSTLAFRCLAEARLAGDHAALVADDRVFLERFGGRIVATRPDAIEGLIELRHSGIGRHSSQRIAVVDYAVMAVDATAERLPPEGERLALAPELDLPLVRIPLDAAMPISLLSAVLGWPLGGMRPIDH